MANETEKTQEKKDLIIQLYMQKAGNVSELCKSVNIGRATFYRWQKEDAKFKEAVEEAGESLIDFVESKLFKLINDENPSAIFFFLKCRAKGRGYIEKQEFEHSGEFKPLQIIIKDGDNKD